MSIFKKISSFFLDLIETIAMALAVFVIIYLFLFQPHQVRGNSMLPNFHDGEYILTDKITYRFHKPKRGEVVIFRSPINEEYDYIKRIIGLPGETVKIENDRVYINNQVLEENYLPEDYLTAAGAFLKNGQPVTIPEGNYLTFGDNRSYSSDSREWGFTPIKNIIGKAWFRYWPLSRMGILPKAEYRLGNTDYRPMNFMKIIFSFRQTTLQMN